MKINTSEFSVENKILAVNENEVIYDMPRQKIQEAWDKLSAFYTDQTLENNKAEVIENEFYTDLANARVENETTVSAFDLLQRNVVKEYECQESIESTSNIKTHIVTEVLSILQRGIEELNENIKDESGFYCKIKEINSEVIISDRSVQIATDSLSHVDYDEYMEAQENREHIGLLCIIKYKNIEVKGFHSSKNFPLIFDCSSFEESLQYKDIEVSLKNEYNECRNSVTTALIEEVFCGKKLKCLVQCIPVLFSRYFLSRLVSKSVDKTIIETSAKKEIDGLSSVFYVLTDDCVVKVIRNAGFEMYYNGKLIKIENKN